MRTVETEHSEEGPIAGSAAGNNRDAERRRHRDPALPALRLLAELPSRILLERLPVPVLAVDRYGAVVFANGSFASLLGYSQERLRSMSFDQIFRAPPVDPSAVSGLRAYANRIVELKHLEGWVVRARMSKSALLRDDDAVALVTFEDLTERSWSGDTKTDAG